MPEYITAVCFLVGSKQKSLSTQPFRRYDGVLQSAARHFPSMHCNATIPPSFGPLFQDKELELSLLQSAVHDLRQQLDESERSRSQLRETLGELEKGRQSMDTIEAALRGRDGEIAKLRATEKQKV